MIEKVGMKIDVLDPQCIPYKKYDTDSGLDLVSRNNRLISLGQHATMIIPVGIRIALEEGFEAQIRPRSGLSSQGIVAELGTIDNSYRGELNVILTNNSETPYHLEPYTRIAQLVINKVYLPDITMTSDLDNTERGANGFGSTGKVRGKNVEKKST